MSMICRLPRHDRMLRGVLGGIAWSVMAATHVAAVEAPSATPEALLGMASQDLETIQVKLTYRGAQEHPIPSIVFTVDGRSINWDGFAPWRQPEDHNDRSYRDSRGESPSFTVSLADVQALLRALAGFEHRVSTTAETQWLACTIAAGVPPNATGFEWRLDPALAKEFFILMRGALRADPKDITLMEGQANVAAMRTLQWWGCALGLLPEEIPAHDVTERVKVLVGGLRFDSTTKRFECSATVRNISEQPIRGPVALVVDLSPNASLIEAHGTTCVTRPEGSAFINLPMPSEQLEPQAALETTLHFEHTAEEPLSLTTRVLAGPGER